MITASQAAKIAYDKNFANIDSATQFEDISKEIEDAAKGGRRYITIKFLTGENHNKLKNELGYTVVDAGVNNHSIQW
jgi:hypothetical protein